MSVRHYHVHVYAHNVGRPDEAWWAQMEKPVELIDGEGDLTAVKIDRTFKARTRDEAVAGLFKFYDAIEVRFPA